jgi:hypothetical protein
MIIDEVLKQSKTRKIIEILIDNSWIPACVTDLRIMNNDRELVRVKALRVRKIK